MSERQAVRAITIRQPYASLIAIGAKRFETRSWSTAYRGPILIHAGKCWTSAIADDCDRVLGLLAGFTCHSTAVDDYLSIHKTLGAVLAEATLVGCIDASDKSQFSAREQEFGWFGPGRYAWRLDDVRPLRRPVPCIGRQGLWTPDSRLLDLVTKARKS